jgi:S-DNA-T family DNA segregation ATPase FtsK/SpoIIIE
LRYSIRAAIIVAYSRVYGPIVAAWLSSIIGGAFIGLWWPFLVLGCMLIAFGWWVYSAPEEILQSLRGWYRSNREYRWTWGRVMRRIYRMWFIPTPILLHTHSTSYKRKTAVDKLLVRMPIGAAPHDLLDDTGLRLSWAWRAEGTTRILDPQPKKRTVELWNLINDPLIDPVPPFTPTKDLLPKHIDCALQEDGLPWQAKIRGGAAHTLVVGISGSGKGSVFGAFMTGLQTGIQARTVEAWGIDPQASEFGMWRHRFARLVYTAEDAADLLEELVGIMRKRTRKLFGIARQHHPTEGDPFYFMAIDEILDLFDKTERKTYRRIEVALGRLLRMGRKASILIFAMSQRAELDILGPCRKDFVTFIALEQNLETDVDMVLGRGALAAGAHAHLIKQPGEAYVAGRKGIIRVRFPETTDDHIAELEPAPGELPPAPGDDELVDMGFA